MKRILPLLLVLWGSQAAAQSYHGAAAARLLPGAASLHLDAQSGQLYFVRFNDAAQPEAKSLLAQSALQDYLGGRQLQATQSTQDALGMTHTRMQAYQDGHPIEGAVAIVHTRQGRVSAVNAKLPRNKGFSGQAVLSASQARENAAAHIGARQYVWQVPGMDNLLRAQTGDPQATYAPAPTLVYAPVDGDFEAGRYRLAWKVDVYATAPLSHDDVYVDAEDGSILWQHSLMQHVDAVGTAVTGFRGTRPITTDSTAPGVYRLSEAGRGGGIHTLNLEKRTAYSTAVEFLDADNHWDNANAALDQYATDVHIGLEDTYDHFLQAFQWNSVDNQAYPLVAYCHYDSARPLAFWDGYALAVGDVNADYPVPFATLHVIAHEFTHGVTQHTAGLYATSEPGAINESFSDILGKAVEAAFHPGAWNWRIGAELNGGPGVRDMQSPNLFAHPDTYEGQYWSQWGRIHTNAGVGNKWFQVLVDGETGVNDDGEVYQVTGIGMDQAAAIAFRALTVYLTPTTRYDDMRFFTIEAARDLYGDCSPALRQTVNAWHAVGLGPASASLPQAAFAVVDPRACSAPAAFAFDNQSSYAQAYRWDFGDGDTSTSSHPTHVYQQPGQYTVRLIVTDCGGQMDTLVRTDYIQVDPAIPCPALMQTGPLTAQTTCEGTLLDPGGEGPYADNQVSGMRISPVGAGYVTFEFLEFSTERGWDQLWLYDGPDNQATPIGVWSGEMLPYNGVAATTSGAHLYLEFKTNAAVTQPGFKVKWGCRPARQRPEAFFTVKNPYSCTGELEVGDVAIAGVETWQWNFGDGNTASDMHPQHVYDRNGTYDIRLIVCNAIGCDTLVRRAAIQVDQFGPCTHGLDAPLLDACEGWLLESTQGSFFPTQRLTLIDPLMAGGVRLDFSLLDLKPGLDSLFLYNGSDLSSPLIGAYSGQALPSGGSITGGPDGILLLFKTQPAPQGIRLAAKWQALDVQDGHVLDFESPGTVAQGTLVEFENLSQQVRALEWDFGDGNQLSGPSGTHRYDAPGTYQVTLRGMSYAGCPLSVTREIHVCRACHADAGLPTLAVWPSPSNGLVEVVAGLDGEAVGRLSVYDMLGKRILTLSHQSAPSLRRQLDLQDVEDGVYLVRYETDAGATTRKVVLQR